MSKLNLSEKIGVILAMVGAVLILVNALYDGDDFRDFLELNQVFFWGGILIWSFGHLHAEQEKKSRPREMKNPDCDSLHEIQA